MKIIWELLFKRTPLPYNNIPPGEIVHGLGEEFGDSKKIIETMYGAHCLNNHRVGSRKRGTIKKRIPLNP